MERLFSRSFRNAATNGANVLLEINQNQSDGFKHNAIGTNKATFSQTNTLSAVANTPVGSVNQTQSSSGSAQHMLCAR